MIKKYSFIIITPFLINSETLNKCQNESFKQIMNKQNNCIKFNIELTPEKIYFCYDINFIEFKRKCIDLDKLLCLKKNKLSSLETNIRIILKELDQEMYSYLFNYIFDFRDSNQYIEYFFAVCDMQKLCLDINDKIKNTLCNSINTDNELEIKKLDRCVSDYYTNVIQNKIIETNIKICTLTDD